MFCLDYAFAFTAHYTVSRFANPGQVSHEQSPWFHVGSGALAGGIAAAVLAPFDVLRQSAVPKGVSSVAFSTIPFMAIYIGGYFSIVRADASLRDKVPVACVATISACAAEFPFDKAKHALVGGPSNLSAALAATLFRVPLGALLLVAYDHILNSSAIKHSDANAILQERSLG